MEALTKCNYDAWGLNQKECKKFQKGKPNKDNNNNQNSKNKN